MTENEQMGPCDKCGQPATISLFRSGTIITEGGVPVAEVDARVPLCQECRNGIVRRGEPMPPARVIRRFDAAGNDDPT